MNTMMNLPREKDLHECQTLALPFSYLNQPMLIESEYSAPPMGHPDYFIPAEAEVNKRLQNAPYTQVNLRMIVHVQEFKSLIAVLDEEKMPEYEKAYKDWQDRNNPQNFEEGSPEHELAKVPPHMRMSFGGDHDPEPEKPIKFKWYHGSQAVYFNGLNVIINVPYKEFCGIYHEYIQQEAIGDM